MVLPSLWAYGHTGHTGGDIFTFDPDPVNYMHNVHFFNMQLHRYVYRQLVIRTSPWPSA